MCSNFPVGKSVGIKGADLENEFLFHGINERFMSINFVSSQSVQLYF